MKSLANTTLSLVFLTFSLLVTAQKEDRTVKPFDELKVTGNVLVELTAGDKESISVEIIDNKSDLTLDKIVTEVDGKTLKIRMTNLKARKDKIKVLVTYKDLRDISANAGCKVIVNSLIKGDKLVAKANSGSIIRLKVDLNTIDLNSSEGGLINISGNVKTQETTVGTGGETHSFNLKSNTAFAKVTTGGKIDLFASNKIDAQVRMGGEINFKGDPKDVTKKVSLGGSINKL